MSPASTSTGSAREARGRCHPPDEHPHLGALLDHQALGETASEKAAGADHENPPPPQLAWVRHRGVAPARASGQLHGHRSGSRRA